MPFSQRILCALHELTIPQSETLNYADYPPLVMVRNWQCFVRSRDRNWGNRGSYSAKWCLGQAADMVEVLEETLRKACCLSEGNGEVPPILERMARYLPLSSVTTGKTQKSPVKQEKYDVA